ncbi:glycosyltransferase [Desulfocurvus sp. DL9XJH121]
MSATSISVIIPVLHEARGIRALVEHVRSLPAPGPVDIVVVDGAPEADTLAVLDAGVTGLACEPGRARQMNEGARASAGDVLLFLHAGTHLPQDGLLLAAGTIGDGYAGGAFSLGFPKGSGPLLWFLALAANLFARCTGAPCGAHAQFLSRKAFRLLGGFADLPLLEDLDIMLRARRRGERLLTLRRSVETSPGRWRERGALRRVGRDLLLRTLFLAGVSPGRLAPRP